ncbi:MAG: hypothetical protein P1U68_05750 [Verrucomicrobiales bacterium]|nr:hypothetical protein [Verrucomicrobiales bacterium]
MRTRQTSNTSEEQEEAAPEADANLHFPIAEKDMIDPHAVQPTVRDGLPVPIRPTVCLSPRMRHRMEELGRNSADHAGLPDANCGR